MMALRSWTKAPSVSTISWTTRSDIDSFEGDVGVLDRFGSGIVEAGGGRGGCIGGGRGGGAESREGEEFARIASQPRIGSSRVS